METDLNLWPQAWDLYCSASRMSYKETSMLVNTHCLWKNSASPWAQKGPVCVFRVPSASRTTLTSSTERHVSVHIWTKAHIPVLLSCPAVSLFQGKDSSASFRGRLTTRPQGLTSPFIHRTIKSRTSTKSNKTVVGALFLIVMSSEFKNKGSSFHFYFSPTPYYSISK